MTTRFPRRDHRFEDDELGDRCFVWRRGRQIPYFANKLRIDRKEPHVPRGLCEQNRGLVEVTIPKWVTKIEDEAFLECSWLNKVNLTEGLLEIGDDVFRCCHSLREINIPCTTKRIGKLTFADCKKLTFVKLSNRLKRIEEGTFYRCLSLIAISIPSSVVAIETDAFHGCKGLRMVNPPDDDASIRNLQLQEIGENAFLGTALHSFKIPSTMHTIGRHAFRLCMALREVQVEEGVETIGTAAFQKCTSLHVVSLPRSLKRIGNRAFDGCSSLVSVELLNVTNIWLGEEAFQGCSSLTNVFVPSHNVPFSSNSSIHFTCFDDCESLESMQCSNNDRIQEVVSSRFDEYPIHKLCYYASATTVEDLRRAVEASERENEVEDYENYLLDQFQMTPFHVLLSSSTPRKDLLKVLLDAYPRHVLNWKDRNGKLAINYLRCSSTAAWSSVLQTVLEGWLLEPIATWGKESCKSKMAPKLTAILAAYRQSHYVVDSVLLDARGALNAYEKYENMRLLELAVWKLEMKFADGISGPIHHNSEDDNDDDANTSENREACRIRCGVSIVAPHVLAFYDDGPDWMSSEPRSGARVVRFNVHS